MNDKILQNYFLPKGVSFEVWLSNVKFHAFRRIQSLTLNQMFLESNIENRETVAVPFLLGLRALKILINWLSNTLYKNKIDLYHATQNHL